MGCWVGAWRGRVKDAKLAKGGTIVLRPDSGDPVQQVPDRAY